MTERKENRLKRRIGSTLYTINVVFRQDAKETVEDKMMRLIRHAKRMK